ncbi:hypothetical protein APH_0133 [Anaplasma phagocytophilum str. HZ]|uniref:Uncharacterized protein n=1 Tax=Anaplasma phagocytophilum (strain HZ) TaxID=212042 RepID=Q2GLJ2_ANAPZ|nr:hypothetical protein APH_0133 [Anaplasma phagocytophilum str. HZ]
MEVAATESHIEGIIPICTMKISSSFKNTGKYAHYL